MESLRHRLETELEGEVYFDDFSRGQYSTDASIYQLTPLGIAIPTTGDDALRALEIAADAGVAILPRGAGTSQCGQAIGEALIIDYSRYLQAIDEVDEADLTVWVEPGVVLDRLNATLKPHGLWYPVDVSTSAQATIGGMTANNSCGARSIEYGNMVHNVLAVDAWLSSGDRMTFAEVGEAANGALVDTVRTLYSREEQENEARVPKVQRRVAGYNLDMASVGSFNMAHLLVGSEGTLAAFRRIKLQLAPLPRHKVLGIVHFPSFYTAMDHTQHIVRLAPTAVELVDRTMIELSRQNPAFRQTMEQSVRGDPDAILLVEFAGGEKAEQTRRLSSLAELMGDLGLPDSVIEIEDAALQKDVWNVRKAGLNIMMSMKGDGKPVSFIEDCAVPLEHLADYTDRLNNVFAKHGTRGTFYAHASVGCLHVRPVLDMRLQSGAQKMRAIAEEACALVREYKGSYSGEHGDGLVRSEWIERVYGPRLSRAFAELKHAFDPKGLMNPGKIVAATKMDDRALFRYKPDYSTLPVESGLDWSQHEVGEHNRGRGFAAAVEMCNNNGHCRKFDAGTMCPSYRVTREERDLTRGRANALRLALSGQLGPDALTSDEMYRTMELCVSCKGCRRECPTGVDMAAMKIEFLHQYHRRHPRSVKDRLIAHLPRYAPKLSRFPGLANLRDRVPGLPALGERLFGLAAHRRLPRWRRDPFAGQAEVQDTASGDEVVLLADTFNRWFEPENLRAAIKVLTAANFRVVVAGSDDADRPLCCGRTYLASGMLDEARAEAERLCDVLLPYARRGVPVIGIEPSCILGLRDEYRNLLPGDDTDLVAGHALMFEEFLIRTAAARPLNLQFKSTSRRALVHGHCHQKAFGVMSSVTAALQLVPGLEVDTVRSSCCGMAGAFGYDARYTKVSREMGEADLLPAVRAAAPDTVIVADGTSCRQQIADGSEREARHVARVLAANLA